MTANSEWSRFFDISGIRVLIVCRGPVRLEAVQILQEKGALCGILLSEKDSITYRHTLAPETRVMDPQRIHRVPDYSGASHEERRERIQEIIQIAKKYCYDYVFAGYGFMAEDADFVESLEKAGIRFMGPASGIHRTAGAKDTAKSVARSLNVSVTPGVDNIASLTLLRKTKFRKEGLAKTAEKHGLNVAEREDLEQYAEAVLQAGCQKNIGLIHLSEIQEEAAKEGSRILKENPKNRLRLKYIGGGGGKGQRIVEKTEEIPNAVLEVLSEAKVMGEADNKNFLIELNIENIRHNEIQLLGNGDWCISLGGRDCSLQMHEQKLVEFSLTEELFMHEIAQARKEDRQDTADLVNILEKDRTLLAEMEEQAVRFGNAVHLNSASTFETIVSGDSFFFMEMNTRIQVEHRVSEAAYVLRFTNPKGPEDFFEVDSLIHAMALIAVFGKDLPCPQRKKRYVSGAEIRLNAQNAALQPAAGGWIEYWSPPLAQELRDDQGISILSPDTKEFVCYHLAGAYDSNIALVVGHGESRRSSIEALAEILRCMELSGRNLQTNSSFHYGILHFCLGLHPMLKPNTNFVLPYLCAVGTLAMELEKIDWNCAWRMAQNKVSQEYGKPGLDILDRKETLILRPLQLLQKNPHACAGWLMYSLGSAFAFSNKNLVWKRNLFRVLADMYRYLGLRFCKETNPIQKIWPHDEALLEAGLDFYETLEQEYADLTARPSNGEKAAASNNGERTWDSLSLKLKEREDIHSTHLGWQLGLSLLDMLVWTGHRSGLFDIRVKKLQPVFPDVFLEEERQKEALRALSPPPTSSADILAAQTGGMFYSRETPDSPAYLKKGSRFSIGDPLYVIEVMKMFNKVYAEFSGTVEEVLTGSLEGKVVTKGQPLFRVKADESFHAETQEEKEERRLKNTKELWACIQ